MYFYFIHLPADATNEESVSAAVQAVQDQIGDGGLNLLINNAAIRKPASSGALFATKKNDMMEVYETNVVGPFTIAKVGLFSAEVGSTNTLLHKKNFQVFVLYLSISFSENNVLSLSRFLHKHLYFLLLTLHF